MTLVIVLFEVRDGASLKKETLLSGVGLIGLVGVIIY